MVNYLFWGWCVITGLLFLNSLYERHQQKSSEYYSRGLWKILAIMISIPVIILILIVILNI